MDVARPLLPITESIDHSQSFDFADRTILINHRYPIAVWFSACRLLFLHCSLMSLVEDPLTCIVIKRNGITITRRFYSST